MSNALVQFHVRLTKLRDDRGATMVEYGLMVALIAIVAILAVTAIGTNVTDIFNRIANALK